MRRELDAYYSPNPVATWLLNNQVVGIEGTIFECASGEGAIARPLENSGFRVWTNDINPEVKADYHYDNTRPDSWNELPKFDWIISNPQYNTINDLLPLAFANARKGIAIYARKSLTEPTFGRQDWLEEHQDNLAQIIYCPRISFTGDGKKDNCSCDWFIWTKEKVRGTISTWVKREKNVKQSALINSTL